MTMPRMRRLVLGVAVLGLIVLRAAGAADAGTTAAKAAKSVEDRAADALWWGDFEDLERVYAEARDPARRNAQGRAELGGFLAGVGRVMRGHAGAPEGYFAQMVALTRRWTVEKPKSPLAKLLHARALYQRAWHDRGGGPASKVPPEAMADFEAGMRWAADYLGAQWNDMRSESAAYVYAVMIGRSAGWTARQQWSVAREGLDKDPDNESIYQELLASMEPAWGGSAEQVDEVVQEAVRRTSARRGLQLYALLYQDLAYRDGEALFSTTRAEWGRMRQGYRDWLERHPEPAVASRFALAACLAKDRPTFVELIARLPGEPLLREWGRGQDGQRRFDACRRWARDG